jgi:hypothetical protein
MPDVIWVHITWMALTVAVGAGSGYLGLLRALQGRASKGILPGQFSRRWHVRTGVVFYGMFYLGILYAYLMQDYLLDVGVGGLWIWHEYNALAIAIVFVPAMFWGFHMLARPAGHGRGRPIAHMVTNGLAFGLIGFQIVLAILLITEVL